MSDRGIHLSRDADQQICEAIDLLSTHGQTALLRPCPGRERLGDGTVAATAQHTADNYHRIAGFLRGEHHGRHQSQPKHSDAQALATIDLPQLLERLSSARTGLSILSQLTDEQLDTVPPTSDMKFCDGQRTLEQIVINLLKHQAHQIDAIQAAIT